MALKVMEVGDVTKTWATVFDTAGNMLLEPEPFQFLGDTKFEGLEFISL